MTQSIIRPLCTVCGQPMVYRVQSGLWKQYTILPNGRLEQQETWGDTETEDYFVCYNQECGDYANEYLTDSVLGEGDLEAFYRQVKGQTHD